MKLILSGGGTGGHIYPALAIAQGLKTVLPTVEILFIGTKKGMESTIVPKAGYDFKDIDISGLDRTSMLKASKSLAKFPKSFIQARNIIKDFQPDVVLGTGGYVSFPVVMASTFFTCKTIIHEQNAVLGLANQNLAKRVDYTLLTFAEAARDINAKNYITTGLPVRQEILNVDRKQSKQALGLDNRFTLIAFGGSRGAARINQAMLELIPRYKDDVNLQIIWITGNEGFEELKSRVENELELEKLKCKLLLYPYMYDIEKALAAADLAVCRAGASTIAELTILGLPAILIPYPYAAGNHQEKNARALIEKKAADMVIDEFLDGDTLYNKVQQLRLKPETLTTMKQAILSEAKPDALADILKVILA